MSGTLQKTEARRSVSSPAIVQRDAASDDRIEPPDTGHVRDDLLAILGPVAVLHQRFRHGTALADKSLMAEAQLDPRFHDRYTALHRHWWSPIEAAIRRGIDRGELRPSTDIGLATDVLLGASWYRLLLEHAPLDQHTMIALVDMVIAGNQSPSPGAPKRWR